MAAVCICTNTELASYSSIAEGALVHSDTGIVVCVQTAQQDGTHHSEDNGGEI